jgi:hypothetical protein
MYEVYNALYGTKDAMRDYRIKVEDMYINKLKCQKLQLCSCIYIKRIAEDIILMLGHVDDYLYGGSNSTVTENFIAEARKHAQYTEPEKNAPKFLGMELERDRSRKTILIRLTSKIEELSVKYPHASRKVRNVPMPVNGYLIRDYELEGLSETKKRLLNKEEITTYMAIVGSLIWIQGIRLDIIFAVLYLSWFTKSPRQHHMDMAEYTVGYLYTTKDMPLVLGGEDDIEPIIDSDASHGTGPNSRSITGELTRLNEKSRLHVRLAVQVVERSTRRLMLCQLLVDEFWLLQLHCEAARVSIVGLARQTTTGELRHLAEQHQWVICRILVY